MKRFFLFILSLPLFPLYSLPLPVVHPPTAEHPNTIVPNPDIPPAPNPPNPYNPYGSVAGSPGSAFSDANAAAMHFINIVDNQIYTGAWLDASGILHDVVPQLIWSEGMRAVRNPLGPVRQRKVRDFRAVRALPGGLVGEFMIIRYDTEFTHPPRRGSVIAIETVTMMIMAPLGVWRVVCYQIN